MQNAVFCSKKENAASVQPGPSSSGGSPNSDAHIAFFPSKQSALPVVHFIFPFAQNGKLLLGEPDEELEEKPEDELLELNGLDVLLSQPDGRHLHLSGSSASHGKGQFLSWQPEDELLEEEGQQHISSKQLFPIGCSTFPLHGKIADCNLHPALQKQPEVLVEEVEEVEDVLEVLLQFSGRHWQVLSSKASQGGGQFTIPQPEVEDVDEGTQRKVIGGRQNGSPWHGSITSHCSPTLQQIGPHGTGQPVLLVDEVLEVVEVELLLHPRGKH